MADTIRAASLWPRSPYVPSPLNLPSFLYWWKHATTAEQESAVGIYLIYHHDGLAVPAEPIKLRFNTGGMYNIPWRRCGNVGCERCTSRRGGYKFDWVGPWTCINLQDDEHNYGRWMECDRGACGGHGSHGTIRATGAGWSVIVDD